MTSTSNPLAKLTDLQRQVYALLVEHRVYNTWTKQPTVCLQQAWIAQRLNATQADISNAFAALRNARLLARCGLPAKGRPQIYFMTGEELATLPDTSQRMRAMRKHIDPDPEEIAKTRQPLGQGRPENRLYEGTA